MMPLPPMPVPPPPSKSYAMVDTECYTNYWLCSFDTGQEFEMYDGHPLDIAGLAAALRMSCIVTFNGISYDLPLICLALQGATTYDLKAASDRIIVERVPHWEICRPFDWIDHIDLINVLPGEGGLKAYMGKMHSKRLQDLPIDPAALITPEQRPLLRNYCRNDLAGNRDAFNAMKAQLALRADMSDEYGIDLRSKSDAQIAEAVMRKLLPFKPQIPYISAGTGFQFRPPTWMRFQSLDLLERIKNLDFTVNMTGGVSPPYHADFIDWGDKQERLSPHGQYVKRPADWQVRPVQIGQTRYAMGIGGLHSMESRVLNVADEWHEITDHDVASYYPSLILQTGIFPQQIGHDFVAIYRGWYDRRLAAKAAGNKKDANSLKTLLNGTFGKLGSRYSIFYAPTEMIQVTLGGQLALLMLIEMLELSGIRVISANTDGIVLKTPKVLIPLRAQVIAWWESVTGFVTERTDYRLVASRDVNSYTAITTDGKAKTKGAFAPAEPGPSGWPNPTGQVSTDAAVAFLQHGKPIEQTIYECTDIRQFVHVRNVKGGGYYCPNGHMVASSKMTQIAMRSVVGDIKDKAALCAAYDAVVAANDAQRQYLGKTVRWYYAANSRGAIVTSTGGMVARTEGCMPCMELPDTLPTDIDYTWYIEEAKSLLNDMGVIK